jgi:hypothetical protein
LAIQKKKTFVIIFIAIFTILYLSSNKPLYGNDKKSIIQVIKSVEGYESGSIEILDIKDIDKDRVVGFLYDNSPAYIHFHKNRKGNYKWNHIEKRPGDSFTLFIIQIQDSDILRFMTITNQENEIAKLKLNVNNQIVERKFKVKERAVYWIDLPKSKDKNYSFKYEYFDKEGNPLNDH